MNGNSFGCIYSYMSRNVYSHLSNNRGGWNKRGGTAKVAKSINVEVGINMEGGIFWKKLVYKSLCSWGTNMSKKIAKASSVDFHTYLAWLMP